MLKQLVPIQNHKTPPPTKPNSIQSNYPPIVVMQETESDEVDGLFVLENQVETMLKRRGCIFIH